MRGQQFFLALDADFVEQDVARVAQQLIVVHCDVEVKIVDPGSTRK